jgi:hypothetical protein
LKRRYYCSLPVALATVAASVLFTTSILAAADWQTADELRGLLIGNGAKLKGSVDGTRWWEKYSEDGSIEGAWADDAYRGKWSFQGDMMCLDYEGTAHDRCWYIAIDGEKTKWWNTDGEHNHDNTKYVAP